MQDCHHMSLVCGLVSLLTTLMCYHVLTQRGSTEISRSILQRVTNLEKTTASVKDTFIKFDEMIHSKTKGISRG
jgi:hypothetical protein